MAKTLRFALSFLCVSLHCYSLRHPLQFQQGLFRHSSLFSHVNHPEKQVIIEVVAKKQSSMAVSSKQASQKSKSVGGKSGRGNLVYGDFAPSGIQKYLDSPIALVFDIIFNPVVLCFAIYLSSFFWMKFLNAGVSLPSIRDVKTHVFVENHALWERQIGNTRKDSNCN
jgi:hypothetical protein